MANKYTAPSMPERFWSRVDKSGGPDACWPWLAATNPYRGGYGQISIDGAMRRAHRVALELSKDSPITPGALVLHSCDNPPCCNPAHLREGTSTDNIRECIAKGRSNSQRTLPTLKRGEAHPDAKLTNQDVLDVRRHIDLGGQANRELCERYGVDGKTLRLIGQRKTWKHLPEQPSTPKEGMEGKQTTVADALRGVPELPLTVRPSPVREPERLVLTAPEGKPDGWQGALSLGAPKAKP